MENPRPGEKPGLLHITEDPPPIPGAISQRYLIVEDQTG